MFMLRTDDVLVKGVLYSSEEKGEKEEDGEEKR